MPVKSGLSGHILLLAFYMDILGDVLGVIGLKSTAENVLTLTSDYEEERTANGA